MREALHTIKLFSVSFLPIQDKPFELRLYPVLQEQIYDPSVF